MDVLPPRRVAFAPDDKATPSPDGLPDEQAPALSSSGALARFEFESGRGNEGTKILMVEWSSEDAGDWEVAWDGKSTTLPAKDGTEERLHRLYFLLLPGSSVPPIVKLSQKGGRRMQTNPLPAIFPPELGLSATTQGRKGVLHTVWAKQRLSVLQMEIEREMSTNGEGVGLEMAMQEKTWIEENFGVVPKVAAEPPYPTSPKTPGGGRLSEKLKGLKLGTSTSELSMSTEQPINNNPLSPDLGDVAVSSFSLFHGGTSRPQRAIAQNPPQSLIAKQNEVRLSNSRISSLDAIASGHTHDELELEDELFAVKMSPRSPEMKKSPFSFA